MAPVPKRDEVAEAFRKLDLDGDGFLSAAELKAVLCRPTPAGIKFTEAKVDELVRRFDTNGDGLLSLEEVIAGWNELGLSPAALRGALTSVGELVHTAANSSDLTRTPSFSQAIAQPWLHCIAET